MERSHLFCFLTDCLATLILTLLVFLFAAAILALEPMPAPVHTGGCPVTAQ